MHVRLVIVIAGSRMQEALTEHVHACVVRPASRGRVRMRSRKCRMCPLRRHVPCGATFVRQGADPFKFATSIRGHARRGRQWFQWFHAHTCFAPARHVTRRRLEARNLMQGSSASGGSLLGKATIPRASCCVRPGSGFARFKAQRVGAGAATCKYAGAPYQRGQPGGCGLRGRGVWDRPLGACETGFGARETGFDVKVALQHVTYVDVPVVMTTADKLGNSLTPPKRGCRV